MTSRSTASVGQRRTVEWPAPFQDQNGKVQRRSHICHLPTCELIKLLADRFNERSYARLPDGGDDFGRSVVGRRRWCFADCARVHGRQVYRGSMYTDQHTDRGGIEAENSVALRAVLWHGKVLPQRGEGLRRGYSTRRGEQSKPQQASPRGCSAAGRPQQQQFSSFNSQNRKPAGAAGEQAGRKYASPAGGGKCVDRARREPRTRDASSLGWSRNRQSRKTSSFAVSRHRFSSNSNQKASKSKASWYGKESYAT